MLRGNYTARVDEKGRLKIPTAFRRYIEEKYTTQEVYVTSLNGDCVRIYPLPEWESIEQRLALLPSMDPARRKFLDRTKDRKSTRLNSSHLARSRMPSSA